MNKNYCVYEHIFPNGKKYIGITSDAEKRWRSGKGYETQPKMARAINKYGWENIKHNIILEGITKKQAEILEMYLIDTQNTVKDGYNTAIGGAAVNASYLNAHILYMIRESDYLDKAYGETPPEDSLVNFVRRAWRHKDIADKLNAIDELIEAEFNEYKSLYSNMFFDGRYERCEAYWYYFRALMEYAIKGECFSKSDIMPYLKYRTYVVLKGGEANGE